MNIRWKILLFKSIFWLFAEIFLNVIGVDDLADYSEFVFERNTIVLSY